LNTSLQETVSFFGEINQTVGGTLSLLSVFGSFTNMIDGYYENDLINYGNQL